MKIHVYALCWNEEKMLPYFLRHYSSFADKIIIYDNMSTDSSLDIIKKWEKTETIPYDSNNKLNEKAYLNIKNKAYKKSRGLADFVMVVDIDEIIYHPDIVNLLKEYKKQRITVPLVKGYEMISRTFSGTDKQLYDKIRTGAPRDAYSKNCIFDPNISINYFPGAHFCNPKGDVKYSKYAELKLLHFKYIDLDEVIKRFQQYKERLSKFNKKRKLTYQYSWDISRIKKQFKNLEEKSIDVLNDNSTEHVNLFHKVVYWISKNIFIAIEPVYMKSEK